MIFLMFPCILIDNSLKRYNFNVDVKKAFSNIGLYSLGIVLSCGPSQVYGFVKGVIDLAKYASLRMKISRCQSGDDFSRRRVVNLTHALKRNEISLKTDLVSMIPLVGALFAWRVMAPKPMQKNLDATRGVSFAAAHALGDFHPLLRSILYPLSSPKAHADYQKIQAKYLKRKADHKKTADYQEVKKACREWKAGFAEWRDDYREYIASLGAKVEGVLESTKIFITQVHIPVEVRKRRSTDNNYLEASEMTHPDLAKRPTVVLFHGNAVTGISMKGLGKFYYRLGFNVLMPTMGGYPGSSPCHTSEATSLQDVEAIKTYLINRGVTQVGYHGLSIGGSVAFQSAAAPTKTNQVLQTLFLVADQTFTSAKDVFANTVNNVHLKVGAIAKGAASVAVPSGEKVLVSEEEWVTTDGLDNLSKAKILKEKGIALIAIEASEDILMKDLRKNSTKPSFASRLLSSYYENEADRKAHFIELDGGHATCIDQTLYYHQQTQLMNMLADFLPKEDPQ